MPIKIPNALPARQTLESENIFVMAETRAETPSAMSPQPSVITHLAKVVENYITTKTQVCSAAILAAILTLTFSN